MLRTIATMPKAPVGVRGDLALAIDALRRPERRRGMAVVISDFLGPINWMRPLRAIAARHEVLGIEVLDPRDVELPDVGDVLLQDAETGRHPRIHHRRATARRLRARRPRRIAPTWRAPCAAAVRRCCRCAPTATGSPTSSVSSHPADAAHWPGVSDSRFPAGDLNSNDGSAHDIAVARADDAVRVRPRVVLPVPAGGRSGWSRCTSSPSWPGSGACCGSPTWSCWKALRPNSPPAGGTCRRSCWWRRCCCSPSRWPARPTTCGFRVTARW